MKRMLIEFGPLSAKELENGLKIQTLFLEEEFPETEHQRHHFIISGNNFSQEFNDFYEAVDFAREFGVFEQSGQLWRGIPRAAIQLKDPSIKNLIGM